MDLAELKARRLAFGTLRLFLLSLLVGTFSFVTFGQTGTWSKQRTGSLAWLHAVYFLDRNRGWAIGSKGTVLITNDGGNTWQPKSASTSDVLRDILFVDDQNGWLVCEVNVYE